MSCRLGSFSDRFLPSIISTESGRTLRGSSKLALGDAKEGSKEWEEMSCGLSCGVGRSRPVASMKKSVDDVYFQFLYLLFIDLSGLKL